MRTVLTYTIARLALLAAAGAAMYLAGARGLLLVALAFLISGLFSYVLLSKQRDALAAALRGQPADRAAGGGSGDQAAGGGRSTVFLRPWRGTGRWLGDIRYRIDAGTRLEDED